MMGWWKPPYVAPGSGPFDCRTCWKAIADLPGGIDTTVFTPYHADCVVVRDEMPPEAIGKGDSKR